VTGAARSPKDRLALAVATLLGAGRSPLVPGTVGTAASLPLVALAGLALPLWGYAATTVCIALAGIWAAGRASGILGLKDPGAVVIDETAGLFVTLMGVRPGWGTLVLGFILFRVADILKPSPARQAERLPGGWGIVVDDLIAGLYANLALRALLALSARLAAPAAA
jgi:phosphatidylglycerophosphatase A